MILRIFTVLFTVLIVWSASAQTSFENELNKILSEPEYKNATVGIHIVDLETGETVFGLNEYQLMVPASTMKLITSATAFELLGEDYRFKTTIGYTGKLKDSKLIGDLVVISGGDPALGSEYFEDHYFNPHFMDVWATKIKAAGINQINGNLVFDASIYDDEQIPDTWIWGDIGNYYGAGPSAFTIYDNLYRITFESPRQAGKATKIVATYPKMENLIFDNNVLSSDINRDQAYIYGSPLDKNREIRGTIPKNRKAFTIKGSNLQPEELFTNEIIDHLLLNGIFVSGDIIFTNSSPNNFNTIYIQQSPTLSEITEVLNHKSVNLFAEHFLKQISAEIQGIGRNDSSISIVKRFWADKLPDPFFMEDGSGLSHFNAISAADFTSILAFMNNQSKFSRSFILSLPTAGEETLSGFDKKLFPGETLQAKSGSMTRVRSYAGYIKTDDGRKLAFCIMLNNFNTNHSEVINKIEVLLHTVKQVY
ncbi:MAG: D-alanyl-D-alanine carboxypeptidase/D-alanyl-D-alanine-endopeptidase [Prolixibacteraceae bacterium]|nr:D-alanyl-D-alanine carboxypeptidase/D-alanyl-D-alanine-endopeptidase [Prolixibacteraceae bacterium]